MPRCYMVKKSSQRHVAPPSCSPIEASVAPPCYSPSEDSSFIDSESNSPETPREHLSETPAVDPLDSPETPAVDPLDSPETPVVYPPGSPETPADHPPTSPPERPPEDLPENGKLSYIPFMERTAADTEAAHDLLSFANSRPAPPPPPPPPPAPEPTTPLLQPPVPSLVPLYTYTLQPTNIFIVTEEPPEPMYPAGPNVTPVPQFEYIVEPQVYVVDPSLGYHPIPDSQFQIVEPLTIPIIVETVPMQLTPQAPPPPPPPPPQVPSTTLAPPASPPPAPHTRHNPNSIIEPGEIRPSSTSKDKPTKYDCNECGKRYATSSNLSRHKQTHRSLDSVAAKKCEDCGKVYVSMPALAMHVLTHKMRYICNVCGKHFSRPWLLRGHSRSHTGEKPYDCPVAGCRKAFGDRSNLRAHLQTHSTDKKFGCCRCLKTFTLKNYLVKHLETTCYRPETD